MSFLWGRMERLLVKQGGVSQGNQLTPCRMGRQTKGFLPKELIPKTKHPSPMQPSVPGSCYIRNWTGRASNVCPHQDTCNKREIIPVGSMMLASSLSSGTRCSPERSLEQEVELALFHWRHFQGSSGPALASSHGQSDLELRPYLSLLSFFRGIKTEI